SFGQDPAVETVRGAAHLAFPEGFCRPASRPDRFRLHAVGSGLPPVDDARGRLLAESGPAADRLYLRPLHRRLVSAQFPAARFGGEGAASAAAEGAAGAEVQLELLVIPVR